MRTILATVALAAVTLLTGCSTDSGAPVSPAPLMSGSGSGGNVGPIPTGNTGGGGTGGTYTPASDWSVLACTEASPCSGGGGNVGPFPTGSTGGGGTGGTVPDRPVR